MLNVAVNMAARRGAARFGALGTRVFRLRRQIA